MKEVHIVVGSLAIALYAVAGLYGAWRWWRVEPGTTWFWRLLRAAQLVVIIQVVLGGILDLTQQKGHKAPSLHIIYGVLPLVIALIAEQLRIAAAQMVLDQRGYQSADEVGGLPEEEQQSVVVAILRRELGVMTLAALVSVVLLARAAGTA